MTQLTDISRGIDHPRLAEEQSKPAEPQSWPRATSTATLALLVSLAALATISVAASHPQLEHHSGAVGTAPFCCAIKGAVVRQ